MNIALDINGMDEVERKGYDVGKKLKINSHQIIKLLDIKKQKTYDILSQELITLFMMSEFPVPSELLNYKNYNYEYECYICKIICGIYNGGYDTRLKNIK